MKKQFIILSILLFIIIIVAPLDIIKAADNIENTTTVTEFRNGKFNGYYKHQFIPYKFPFLCNSLLNQTKNKNVIEIFKDIIEFINKNILGIIFLLFLCYFICRYFIHNFYIKLRFKRERIEKNKNFKIARCKEEKTKNRVYVVYEKDNNGQGKYHHIVDNHTFKKLGYNSSDDGLEEFSKNDKKIGKRIELYNIKEDILFVIGSVEKMKELKNDMIIPKKEE